MKSNSAFFHLVLLVVVSWIGAGAAVQASQIDGGSGCGFEGQTVRVPLDFVNSGGVTSLQVDVTYDDTSLDPASLVYTGGTNHLLDWQVTAPGNLRVLLHSADQTELPSGSLVDVEFDILPAASGSNVPLPLAQPIFANLAAGRELPLAAPADGDAELAIIDDPLDTIVCNGATAMLDVSVSSGGTTAYQWLKNGESLSGEVGPSLQLAVVDSSTIGLYQVELTNSCGTGTSEIALVNVNGVCAPASLSAYDSGIGGRVELRWNPNPSVDIDGYRLYWGPNESGPYTNQQDLGPTGEALLTGVGNDARVYFRVTANAFAEESPFSNESDAVPTSGGLFLPQAPEYGYLTTSGDTSRPDVITYRFSPRHGDTTVSYEVYDIDAADEAVIRLNGVELQQIPTTGDQTWSSRLDLFMPRSLLRDDEPNVLTFDNLDVPDVATERWGARNVSIKLPAPGLGAEAFSRTVDLAIGQLPNEPTLAGFDIYRTTVAGFPPSPSTRIASGVTGTLFRDTAGIVDGTTYYYVVRPVDTIDAPGFDSIEVSATPSASIVTPITDLTLEKSGNDVAFDWSAVSTANGVQTYRVYEGPMPGSLSPTGEETSATTLIRSGDLVDGQVHYYWISVVDGLGTESTR